MAIFETPNIYLFVIEIISFLGFTTAFFMASILSKNYPKISRTKSWIVIQTGLFCGILHSLFDILDTFNFENLSDWFDLFDGLFFFTAIALIAIGLLLTSTEGKKQWGL